MPISVPFFSSIVGVKKSPASSSLRQLEEHLLDKPGPSPATASFGRLSGPAPIEKIEKIEKRNLSIVPDAPKCNEFERVFRYFDVDGDGKISAAELCNCMRTVGQELSQEDAEAVVESTDSDGDGLLGFEDFIRLMEVEGEEEKGKDLMEAFGLYVIEGSECITPKSLRRMLCRLGESKTIEECKGMIRRFDLNGDGVLSFEEFKVMMLC